MGHALMLPLTPRLEHGRQIHHTARMNSPALLPRLWLMCLALAVSLTPAAGPAAGAAQVLIVVGPSTHPPGTHEVGAGGKLMKHCLETAANLRGIKATVVHEWPKDDTLLDSAATVVFIGDTFPPARLPDSAAIMARLGKMMTRGAGIVCVHYATGLRAEDVAENGDHPLLHWMGGYFATRCRHHQSIARVYAAATITPATPQHPVSRGWKEFTLHDEPYINNYFGPDANSLAPGVTALATSLLPPEAPKREIVAWCAERPDGGRGFGIVMPHFIRSWENADLRTFIFNGIVWTAKLEVPRDGVQTTLPDLKTFEPAALDPVPKAPAKKAP
jgi:type 1 glutamine amidotransferase